MKETKMLSNSINDAKRRGLDLVLMINYRSYENTVGLERHKL
jgi:hypothetical protein